MEKQTWMNFLASPVEKPASILFVWYWALQNNVSTLQVEPESYWAERGLHGIPYLKIIPEKFFTVHKELYDFFENTIFKYESLALTILVTGNPQF